MLRRPLTRSEQRWGCVAVLVFGVLFLGGSIWSTWYWSADGVETNATVVGPAPRGRLLVRFTTNDGRQVEARISNSTSRQFDAGAEVRIRFIPRDPANWARMAANDPGGYVIAAGVAVLAGGIALTVFVWRRTRPEVAR